MSWNIDHYYSCLWLSGIKGSDQFESLLSEYSEELLNLIRSNPVCARDYDELDLDLDLPDEELLTEINDSLRRFVKETSFEEDVLYVLLESEYDSENSCNAIVDFLSKKLFAYSSDPYFILSSAAFDSAGGYSHQKVCYKLNNEFVVDTTYDFFGKFFKQPQNELNRVLSAIQEV
jgi:hypothetical protein